MQQNIGKLSLPLHDHILILMSDTARLTDRLQEIISLDSNNIPAISHGIYFFGYRKLSFDLTPTDVTSNIQRLQDSVVIRSRRGFTARPD